MPDERIGERVVVCDKHGEWTGIVEKGCCSEHVYVRADPEPGSGPLRRVTVTAMSRNQEGTL